MEKVKDKFKAKCYNVNIGYIDIKYLSIKWGINNMKQIIFIFCMILVLSFCGCTNVGSNRNEYMSNWFKSEQEISDNMMKQIIDLYNEGNVKEFEKLFSQNSKKDIEDINKQISSFFEFIDGDIQEYSGDCASSSENNNGNKRIELDGMYHISTSKNEYYLNFYMVYKADDVPSDIGLSKIEITTEQTVNRENFMWDTSENGIFVVRE